MATVTLTPTNIWQVDYGVVTAKNPSAGILRQIPAQRTTNLSNQRAVFLEYVIPANAAYRHGLITDTRLKVNLVSSESIQAGWYSSFYKNNGVDLDIHLGKNIGSAGSALLKWSLAPEGQWSASDSPVLKAKNRKIYIGQILTLNSTYTGFKEGSFNNYGMQLDYTAGTFAVTPNVTGGYLPAHLSNRITLTATEPASILIPYTVSSGVFYYKKSSASSYSSISFSGDTVTIPANTFQSNNQYNYYFSATADDGSTTTTSVYTISTNDVVGTVTALSPNNMMCYGSVAFRWAYDNSLGNPQYAFDLQTSTDGSSWTDLVSHSVTSNTSYTATISTSGTLYWRVRSYNQGNVASAWSAALPFTNVLPPDPPVITSITGTGRITVAWTASNQVAYHVVVGDHDSGWIYSSEKNYFLNDYLENGSYPVKVRIANNMGLVSDWATATYTQTDETVGPGALIEMREGYNKILFTGEFERYYILRNGIPVAETTLNSYEDYFCNGIDEYAVRGVNSDDTFGDAVISGNYTCRKPALITPDNQIVYVNERLDEQPQISSSETKDVVSVAYLGRTKPVHHTGDMVTRTWTVTCSRNIVPGKVYFYRNFRGDKAWVICTNVQSALNWFGVHEYQYTLEETDYSEAIEYAV